MGAQDGTENAILYPTQQKLGASEIGRVVVSHAVRAVVIASDVVGPIAEHHVGGLCSHLDLEAQSAVILESVARKSDRVAMVAHPPISAQREWAVRGVVLRPTQSSLFRENVIRPPQQLSCGLGSAPTVVGPPIVYTLQLGGVEGIFVEYIDELGVAPVAFDGCLGYGVDSHSLCDGRVHGLAMIDSRLGVQIEQDAEGIAHRVVGAVQPIDELHGGWEEGAVPGVSSPAVASWCSRFNVPVMVVVVSFSEKAVYKDLSPIHIQRYNIQWQRIVMIALENLGCVWGGVSSIRL